MAGRWNARQRASRVNLIGACVAIIILFFLFRDSIFPSSSSRVYSNSYSSSLRLGDHDVEMVIASMKHENVSWLDEYLPEWKKNIYVVDDNRAKLTVPLNKGREAMVYLTYAHPRRPSVQKFPDNKLVAISSIVTIPCLETLFSTMPNDSSGTTTTLITTLSLSFKNFVSTTSKRSATPTCVASGCWGALSKSDPSRTKLPPKRMSLSMPGMSTRPLSRSYFPLWRFPRRLALPAVRSLLCAVRRSDCDHVPNTSASGNG